MTPKRISYAHEKEKELYESLVALTNSRQMEIQKLILQALNDIKETLVDQACSLEIPGTGVTFVRLAKKGECSCRNRINGRTNGENSTRLEEMHERYSRLRTQSNEQSDRRDIVVLG